jgi:hypothetical protein
MKDLLNLSSVKLDSVDENGWAHGQFGLDTRIALLLLEDYILGKTDTNLFNLQQQTSLQYNLPTLFRPTHHVRTCPIQR